MHNKQKLSLSSAIILALIFLTNALYAKTLIYNRTDKTGNKTDYSVQIEKTDTGYIIKEAHNGDSSIFHTDESFATLKWIKKNPDKNTDITAERVGERIIVSGKVENKEINKNIKIDEKPWLQEWNAGFQKFIKSGDQKYVFWALDPTAMKRVTTFQLEKKKSETISINGKNVETFYAWLSPTSKMIRKLFWEGEGWSYGKSDGFCVQQKDEDGNFQLVEIKN